MTKPVLIQGETYYVRDKLRALGGKWDSERKGWWIPASKVSEARMLVFGHEYTECPEHGCELVRGRCGACDSLFSDEDYPIFHP